MDMTVHALNAFRIVSVDSLKRIPVLCSLRSKQWKPYSSANDVSTHFFNGDDLTLVWKFIIDSCICRIRIVWAPNSVNETYLFFRYKQICLNWTEKTNIENANCKQIKVPLNIFFLLYFNRLWLFVSIFSFLFVCIRLLTLLHKFMLFSFFLFANNC